MEKVYQYMWRYKIYQHPISLTDGREISIVNPGTYNTDSGPDFFNAHILIEDQHWAGNVEIHTKATDWHRHGHHKDPVYDTVILHAVGVNDAEIYRSNGEVIPQMLLTYNDKFLSQYACLAEDMSAIRCRDALCGIEKLAQIDWLESLRMERLQMKSQRVAEIFEHSEWDWEQTCFVMLARSLGFGLNGDPFERVARMLPLHTISKHSDSILQLEALIFGQSGLIDPAVNIFDEYQQAVCREYQFLSHKYGLRPISSSSWKYSRTRPQNFPHRRLAFLAQACRGGFQLFSEFVSKIKDVKELQKLFEWELQGYWAGHTSFGVEGSGTIKLSKSSINGIIINCVSPLVYTYARYIGDEDLAEHAVNLLNDIPSEQNVIVKEWERYGVKSTDAAESQSLIHLRKEYCDKKRCFNCRFGYQLLKKTMLE